LTPARAFLAAEAVVVLAVALALVLASGCGPVSEALCHDEAHVLDGQTAWGANCDPGATVTSYAVPGGVVVECRCSAPPAPSAAPAAALMPEGS
jgi:hypothetical protein